MGYGFTKIKELVALGFIMGMVYYTMEGFWRGWTNIAMLFIGGLCGVFIGLLNQFPQYYRLKIWQQSIIGTIIILSVELLAGLILNIWLQLRLWDYSGISGNLLGQIALPYAVLWFIITPFAIWIDDWLRWRLFHEGEPYTLKEIYLELITLR